MKFSHYLGKNEHLLSDVRIREAVAIIRNAGCDENEFDVELSKLEGPGRSVGGTYNRKITIKHLKTGSEKQYELGNNPTTAFPADFMLDLRSGAFRC